MHAIAFLLLSLTLAGPQAPDASALEREARQLETMLVAPCCWSQPVSQHQSQASDEVKQQIRALLASGRSRQQVLDAFVAQYGARILVEPPMRGVGSLLYGGLTLAFVVTAWVLVFRVRRASRRPHVTGTPAAAAAAATSEDSTYAERLDEELRDMD
jgi:cytochrome c-type biogenesis protein CcmH